MVEEHKWSAMVTFELEMTVTHLCAVVMLLTFSISILMPSCTGLCVLYSVAQGSRI